MASWSVASGSSLSPIMNRPPEIRTMPRRFDLRSEISDFGFVLALDAFGASPGVLRWQPGINIRVPDRRNCDGDDVLHTSRFPVHVGWALAHADNHRPYARAAWAKAHPTVSWVSDLSVIRPDLIAVGIAQALAAAVADLRATSTAFGCVRQLEPASWKSLRAMMWYSASRPSWRHPCHASPCRDPGRLAGSSGPSSGAGPASYATVHRHIPEI